MELLGRGGMGQVFRARDRHLNRPVALKFVLAQETPGMLARLVLEAQYQASLNHPHIAKVYGVGTWEGRTCVVMQLIEGESLDRLPDLSLDQRVELVAQAARGMHAAHLHGLIHRDLKPQNIMVERRADDRLHAYVVDFGLARDTEAESMTISGAVMGSPHYMSPEQAMGGRLVDARTDIYSLGATLYAVVAGAPPFSSTTLPDALLQETKARDLPAPPGEAPTPPPKRDYHALSVLRRVLDDPPAPPRMLNPEVSKDLDTILLHCLEKDPADRYPSAAALADDLDRLRAGQPISVRPTPWARRTQAWFRRHPKTAVLLASALGVGLLALGASGVALRRARSRAEIALRFERAAEAVGLRFRLAALGPPHDRTGETRRIQALMEEKHREAEALGALAQGPGAYFQGRMLLYLGRFREALTELQRAWDLGFHAKPCAQALGFALLEVHFEESRRLTGDASERRAAQQALGERYLRPAVRYFQLATEGGVDGKLHQAQVAFVEGRDGDALALVDTELAESPWSLDAQRLRYLLLARQAEGATDLATFQVRAAAAEAQLRTLEDVGRGDPQSLMLSAFWWLNKARHLVFRFRELGVHEFLQTALDMAERAARLDASSAEPYDLKAEAWNLKAEILDIQGHSSQELDQCLIQQLREADQALARNPRSEAALVAKGFVALTRAERGMSSDPQNLDEILRHAELVLRTNPQSVVGFRL